MTNRSGSSRRVPTRVALVAVLGLLLAAVLPLPAAVAAPTVACDNQTNNTYRKLLECVTLDGVREHQAQFQKIADNNDDPFYPGTRAAAAATPHDHVRCRRRRPGRRAR